MAHLHKRCLFACTCAIATLIASAVEIDHNQFEINPDTLIKKGNEYYIQSDQAGIQRCVDLLEEVLNETTTGRFSKTKLAGFRASLNKLKGDYHYENGTYLQAEVYFRQALDIYKRSLTLKGPDHEPMIHRELAQLYYKMAQEEADTTKRQQLFKSALSEIGSAHEGYGNFIVSFSEEQELTYIDLKTQMAICYARLDSADKAVAVINDAIKSYQKTDTAGKARENYHEALRKKGKILMLGGGDRKEAARLYKDFYAWRRNDALSSLGRMNAQERENYWMRMRPFLTDAYQLEDEDPGFLYDITLFSKGLLLQLNRLSRDGVPNQAALGTLKYTWKNDIAKRLKPGTCAIEFIQYEKDYRQRLAALVLKPGKKPQWIAMTPPDELMSYNVSGRTVESRTYSTNGSLKDALYNDSTLAAMIWNEELCAAIGDCKRVYFAPDGYLHQIAVEYMVPTALAGTSFYRLSSTRRLMEDASVNTDSALLVGGIYYDITPPKSPATGNDSTAYAMMRNSGARFSYLKGTKAECDSILSIRHCSADTLLTTTGATETAFCQLCNNYPIVALATHAYFSSAKTPQGTDLKPCATDESLSQSAIALAGANSCLKDEDFDTSCHDGLLSALELSQMDMSNVDLAVLSACQTALGYVTADGVYGIQRGLKNAGTGCMLISLWNVDDTATSLLMTRFHLALSQGLPPHQALEAARQWLINNEAHTDENVVKTVKFSPRTLASKVEYTRGKAYVTPQYTNAFILIDALD